MPHFVICVCEHEHGCHTSPALGPACDQKGCTCLQYHPKRVERPPSTSPLAPAPPDPADMTVEQLFRLAGKSPKQSTQVKAERIAEQVRALRNLVSEEIAQVRRKREAEEEKQRVRDNIERLKRELAEQQAKLKGGTGGRRGPTAVTAERDLQCPSCPEKFASPQAVGAHRAKKHGYRRGQH